MNFELPSWRSTGCQSTGVSKFAQKFSLTYSDLYVVNIDIFHESKSEFRQNVSAINLGRPNSNQVTLITDKPVHTTQNPEFSSEYEFDSLKF